MSVDNGLLLLLLLVQVIQSMYSYPKAAVKFKGGSTWFFEVEVDVHQGSVLRSAGEVSDLEDYWRQRV